MLVSCIRFCFVLTVAFIASPAPAQLIVAHRGASAAAPENTWQHDCDGIEGDFYLTADQQIVCIHDKTTKRTTGVDLVVEESTLPQLRELDAGRWKDTSWSGQRIPTFEEVLGTVPPGGLFVIELKSKSPIVPVLARTLERLDTSMMRLLIISFDADTVRACKKHLPAVPAHWLTKFERSTPLSRYRPTAAEVARTVQRCGADGVGFKGMTEVVDGEFVERLRAAGCGEYHVWTIDSESDAKYFQTLGVYGITTNRPRQIGLAIRQAVTP